MTASGGTRLLPSHRASIEELVDSRATIVYNGEVLFNPHKRRTPPCLQHESAPKPAIRSELMPACNYCTYLTTGYAIQIPPILRIERDIFVSAVQR